mmetsp:Transcript_124450/g.398045  ORF Transcript_124450/g.398045 Transcript_124450/m.398045 type:complete len:500 (-) Transcript_124450:591-2090(-)
MLHSKCRQASRRIIWCREEPHFNAVRASGECEQTLECHQAGAMLAGLSKGKCVLQIGRANVHEPAAGVQGVVLCRRMHDLEDRCHAAADSNGDVHLVQIRKEHLVSGDRWRGGLVVTLVPIITLGLVILGLALRVQQAKTGRWWELPFVSIQPCTVHDIGTVLTKETQQRKQQAQVQGILRNRGSVPEHRRNPIASAVLPQRVHVRMRDQGAELRMHREHGRPWDDGARGRVEKRSAQQQVSQEHVHRCGFAVGAEVQVQRDVQHRISQAVQLSHSPQDRLPIEPLVDHARNPAAGCVPAALRDGGRLPRAGAECLDIPHAKTRHALGRVQEDLDGARAAPTLRNQTPVQAHVVDMLYVRRPRQVPLRRQDDLHVACGLAVQQPAADGVLQLRRQAVRLYEHEEQLRELVATPHERLDVNLSRVFAAEQQLRKLRQPRRGQLHELLHDHQVNDVWRRIVGMDDGPAPDATGPLARHHGTLEATDQGPQAIPGTKRSVLA